MSTQRDPLWEARRQLSVQKTYLERAKDKHRAKEQDIEEKIIAAAAEVDRLEEEEGLTE